MIDVTVIVWLVMTFGIDWAFRRARRAEGNYYL